ncbi:hypothetical protein [uncultured Ramlibacter sp.]|uniref:hypothetical protein n=1 Tax=uncultured Ramlibacter sp. TaxID=260755 RepID=UPI00261EEDBE|nr:hypothetical protein [uncultured Ramlibacter sp.]
MSLSNRVADATFTKFIDVSFLQATDLLGLYEFRGPTPTRNKAGVTDLVVTGSPTYVDTGVIVSRTNGFDTGYARPVGDFSYAALVRGADVPIFETNGVLFVNELNNGGSTSASNGNHLGYRASTIVGNRGVAGYFAQFGSSTIVSATIPVTVFDPTKHYLMAMTRIGFAVKTYLFDVGRTPTTASNTTPSTETVPRNIQIGTYTGIAGASLAGSGEITGAAIWHRGLSLADLQDVYDYYSLKAPQLGVTLAGA